jgi:2-dehydropantoate 2-reductase
VRFIVYGAGAVGGTIGAALFEAGRDVVLIARGDHYRAMAARGLRFETPTGEVTLDVPVAEHPGAVVLGEEDVLLLTVKSHQTPDALRALTPSAPATLPIVCAQNGVANERACLRSLAAVYGMRVNLPASHLQPGSVHAHAAPVFGFLDVGCYPEGEDERAGELAVALEEAGFSSRPDPSVMRWKYRKLLTNLRNAIDVCCGPEDPAAGELHELAMAEGEACLAAAGIDVATRAEDRARREEADAGGKIIRSEYPGNSTWQSVTRGSDTEVDYLNGEIVLIGRLRGVPTPVNELLQTEVHRLVAEKIPPASTPAFELIDQIESRKAT